MDERPTEEVEHIPWSQLLEEHRAARPWAAYLAAGIVAAVAIGVVGARSFRMSSPPASVPASVPTTVVSPEEPAPASVPPTSSATYTEADLLAAYPGASDHAAVARAEWFVTDYFTRDGAGDDPPTSVEWARAFDVVEAGPDRLRVTVGFRNVTAVGSSWERGPVRAVTVTIAGGQVAGLPEPAEVAVTTLDEEPPAGALPTDLPPVVATALLEAAAGWGGDPVLVGAEQDETGRWIGVVEVAGDSGQRWRLEVVSPPD